MADETEKNSKSNKYKRIFVTISASWGNDDADSSIKVSRRQWSKILDGEEYSTSSYSYYEGERYAIGWEFNDKKLTVWGDDGACHCEDFPIEELSVYIE